ncbi:MAG TPA: hypothetical protein VIZ90_06860 [Rhizobiaceae bacterium]
MTFTKFGHAFMAVAGTTLTSASARDLSFRDFPYLVYCEMQGVDRAFYFSRLGTDGVAVYLTPDNQAGTITIDGVARRVGGEQTGSCADKTIDDLRSSGQAYDLPK